MKSTLTGPLMNFDLSFHWRLSLIQWSYFEVLATVQWTFIFWVRHLTLARGTSSGLLGLPFNMPVYNGTTLPVRLMDDTYMSLRSN